MSTSSQVFATGFQDQMPTSLDLQAHAEQDHRDLVKGLKA